MGVQVECNWCSDPMQLSVQAGAITQMILAAPEE